MKSKILIFYNKLSKSEELQHIDIVSKVAQYGVGSMYV